MRGRAEGADDGTGIELHVVHGATPTSDPAFQPRPFLKDIKDVKDLLFLTQEEFNSAFKGSAVKRAKRRGLLRNAIAVLAGRDDPEAIAALKHALDDPEDAIHPQQAAPKSGKLLPDLVREAAALSLHPC